MARIAWGPSLAGAADRLGRSRREEGSGDSHRRTRLEERLEARHIWVPAEQIDEFNANIIGEIEIVAAYQGGVAVSPLRFPFL